MLVIENKNIIKSETLFKRALRVIPGGVNSPVRAFKSVGGTPFFTEKAEGALLTTADSTELIDYVCTWGPAIHGHNNPNIRDAVQRALNKGTSFGTPNPYEVELAEMITEKIPSVEKIRMANSGTEATMTAIRLARGYTGRDKIIKFEGCYHGHSDALLVKAGSGALTCGYPDSAGVPKSFIEHTLLLPLNDIKAVASAFSEYKDEIAGVILEPYPANCGLILPKEGYLKELKALCDANKAVLIFDEVMTGFRIGFGGVQEKEGIRPDLSTFGKIIGGGLPVGALGGRAEIMDYLAPLGPVYQAGTLNGNPLAMAAGISALELLQTQPPYERLEKMGSILANALTAAAKDKGLPLQVPQIGSMFALFFADEPIYNFEEAIASKTDLFKKLFHFALKYGVYLPPSAYETCFISTAHTERHIEETINVLVDAINAL